MEEKEKEKVGEGSPAVKEVKKKIIPDGIELIQESFSKFTGSLAEALSKAQGAMINGAKDKEGYGYSYMPLDSLTDIIRPQLAENGLAVIQSHQLLSSKKQVLVNTTLMHSSGEWYKTSLGIPITEMKQLSKAQMMGVSMTYGRRYALQALFMIASEEDTDGKEK